MIATTAVVALRTGADALLELREVDLPRLAASDVLVAMERAPLNHSDFMSLRGDYVENKVTPFVPGTVGVGRVVDCGASLRARLLRGLRVCCAGSAESMGTWAEYVVVSAERCVPVSRSLPGEIAANLLSNANTAAAIIRTLHASGHTALIQTAAASEIGRLIAAGGREKGLTVINLVRKEAHVAALRAAGEQLVLNTEAAGFSDEFRRLCATLRPTVLLDAVAGPQTRVLSHGLSPGGEVILCGKLSGEDAALDQNWMSATDISYCCFSIIRFIERLSLPARLLHLRAATRLARAVPLPQRATIALSDVPARWREAEALSGCGKTQIAFGA